MRYRQARHDEPLLYELDGTMEADAPVSKLPHNIARKTPVRIPTLSESEIVRHYTVLSQMNYGVDSGFYPLGSCTMKYNPKISEEIAGSGNASTVHPNQDPSMVQGTLRIMYELQEMLCEISGTKTVSLQPAAGAQGEFTGLLMVRAFHELNGEERDEIVLPDSAHGTNPASAVMAGYKVISIPSKDGRVDLDALDSALSDKTAAFMLTNPNTLGIFESEVREIAKRVHDVGALLYYDGANLNAIIGKSNPGKMGFDIVHFNLHKTFATPHGGGGPGSGPVGVVKRLERFLPVPIVRYNGEKYYLDYNIQNTIGKIHGYYGNWAVILKAYIYILLNGGKGLERITEMAVLNSNYLRKKMESTLEVPYSGLRGHEFVASGSCMKDKGIRTLDIAKRLLDYGFHPPTVYFPQLVEEALMVEPTESFSKGTLDAFADAVAKICAEDPEIVRTAPHNTAVGRVNEAEAARNLILSYWMMETEK